MAVVNINSRVTDDQRAFDQYSSSDKSLLWLSSAATATAFSVDVTVGEVWSEKYGPDSNEMLRIPEDGLLLARHGSIVVEAAQQMKVPHNLYGILVPTGSLFLDKGILIAPAKVEPSFTGRLKFRLFNTTAYRHHIRKDDKLGSIVFFPTETTRFQPEVTKAAVLVTGKVPVLGRARKWIARNANQLVSWIVTLIGSSMAAALISYFVLTPTFPHPSATSPLTSTSKKP